MLSVTSRLVSKRILHMVSVARNHQPIQSMLINPRRRMSTFALTLEQPSPVMNVGHSLLDIFKDWIWKIKRTYQPSILRKKRKAGYLKRSKSVGGRKILRRRRAKGRARLFGA